MKYTTYCSSLYMSCVLDIEQNHILKAHDSELMKIMFVQVEREHPDFETKFNKILRSVDAKISKIDLKIDQNSVANLINLLSQLGKDIR